MASLLDKVPMAPSLGSRFLGLPSPSASIERLMAPPTRCSVGAPLPRNTSPKKNRSRGVPPASRTDPSSSPLARPLFGDAMDSKQSPAQRLEFPRASLTWEAVPSSDSRWSSSFESEDSPVRSPSAMSSATPPSSTVGMRQWLSAAVDEPMAWQRSMLETHWLLDAPELRRSQPLDEPEGVQQITGTTRRNRTRRKHSYLKALLTADPEASFASSPEASSSGLVMRSSLSARERRRVSKLGSLLSSTETTSETSNEAGSSNRANLQLVCSQKSRLRSSPSWDSAEASSAGLPSPAPLPPRGAEEAEKFRPPVLTSSLTEAAPDDVSTNHVWSFMRDIGYVKLLTKEEEVELATTFRAGEELKQARIMLEEERGGEVSHVQWAQHVGLTVQQLRRRVHLGEKARERLIAANMRLVISVIKKYTRPGMSVADLVTAGTVGLARGVDRFDPSKGFKLSTYVHWWIRQAVTRAAAGHVGAYHLPMHMHDTLAKVRKAKAHLTVQGCTPTPESIGNYLGVSERRIKRVQKLKLKVKSLDEACPCPGFSEGSPFHNFVFDEEEDLRSWNAIEASLLKEDLCAIMLDKLNVRERDILCMHYGIDSEDGTAITLDTISARYGVSRERVRQVEMVAIRKLQNLCIDKDLKRYCY